MAWRGVWRGAIRVWRDTGPGAMRPPAAALTSAPCLASSETISTRPAAAALMRAEVPLLPTTSSTATPALSSDAAASPSPASAAIASAVLSGRAPEASSRSTALVSRLPRSAPPRPRAACSGAASSGSAPCASSSCSAPAWPRKAACERGVAPCLLRVSGAAPSSSSCLSTWGGGAWGRGAWVRRLGCVGVAASTAQATSLRQLGTRLGSPVV